MKSVHLLFATHNHQPLGNFDYIIEEAFERSYLPFFGIAAKYPNVRFATHFTGMLLDWLKQHHPDYIAGIKQLVDRGQLEIISGGFYEPILSVISPSDQQAQIKKLTQAIDTTFSYKARGMWLAERVWEQQLAGVLHDANIGYVFLDDTHFVAAGLAPENLNGYYITEDQGKTLAVFPIAKELRYTIPFLPVDETLKVLQEAASESGDAIVCFADDGEKFGVWPNTFDHVYRDGWLEEFFRKLSENASWIKTGHGSEIVQQVKPKGRIYLPNSSYAEMMQWALPSAAANQLYDDFVHKLADEKEKWEPYMQFVRGGFWRNFFVKYPESNHLQKHVMHTSKRWQALADAGNANVVAMEEAHEHILAAECNDPYWHGVFGGIYLNNLRHEAYTSIIQADAMLDVIEACDSNWTSLEDFNADGANELILESDKFSIYFEPSTGGAIREIDFKPRNFNALNILNRRPEAYHKKLAELKDAPPASGTQSIHDLVLSKEEGLEKYLVYDWYRHGGWIEHFLSPDVTLEEFAGMRFEERADFLSSPFELTTEVDGNSTTVNFERTGNIWQNGHPCHVHLKKSLTATFGSGDVELTYELTNVCAERLLFKFGSEWTWNLLSGDAHDRYFTTSGNKLSHPEMASIGIERGLTNLAVVDEWLKVSIDIAVDTSADFFRAPIETVSLSEAGFERVYQGSIVMPVWNVVLEPNEKSSIKLHIKFTALV
ncbi:MAG: alpha-amylase/4-alpha-glucanotransferase domain-containing protein [Candidatus Kapaibacterium sp.]|jgi:hypothetical protein